MAPERKLYGLWLSPFFSTAALVLEELELDYEFVLVNLFKGEHKQPSYLSKNPFGLVPTLEDGDVTVFETGAIIRYLAHTYSKEGLTLYGTTPAERAAVEQWVEASGQNLSPSFGKLIRQTVFSQFNPRDEASFQEALQKAGQVLDVYETRLGKSKYLAGDFVSLADLAPVAAWYHLVKNCPEFVELVEARPNVKAWWQDISSRPAWQKVGKEVTAATVQLKERAKQNA